MRLNRSVLPIASLGIMGAVLFGVVNRAESQSPMGFVLVQPTTPGLAQVGNTNVTGMSIMGGFRLTTGAGAGRYLVSDGVGNGTWTPFPSALAPTGPAGGDLTGTYPNPSLAILPTSLFKVSGAVMTSNGTNIGVGLSSPTARLHVLGRGYFETGFGGTPTISLAVGDTDTGLNSAGDGLLDMYSNNVRALSVRGGRVGIGTSTPGSVLHVNGATSSVSIFAGDLTPFGSAAFQTNLSNSATHAWFAENSNRVAPKTATGWRASPAGATGTLPEPSVSAQARRRPKYMG